MKDKMVHRYYCDFCKKSGCGKYAMEQHELHCTMNPGRSCGMCAMVGEKQADTESMLDVLPDGLDNPRDELLRVEIKKQMPILREITHNCPACILAALRQSHLECGDYIEAFDFQAEAKEFFDFSNRENRLEY
jgi:hypothetical protein